jgi:CheY-like chemotaxis protein
MFTLPIDTPIIRAAALMAFEGIHRIGVLAEDGGFVGLVTSLDVMRWVAREEGVLIGDSTVRAASRKGSILIIDDDIDLAFGYQEIISEEGYTVVTAANGVDAMKRLEGTSPPSLIILDLNMPVMDGRRFRAELLRDPRTARIPVVVISGDRHGPAEIRKLAVNGFLTKPITLEQLLGTVEQYCAN